MRRHNSETTPQALCTSELISMISHDTHSKAQATQTSEPCPDMGSQSALSEANDAIQLPNQSLAVKIERMCVVCAPAQQVATGAMRQSHNTTLLRPRNPEAEGPWKLAVLDTDVCFGHGQHMIAHQN